jgi:hypothetical protein
LAYSALPDARRETKACSTGACAKLKHFLIGAGGY